VVSVSGSVSEHLGNGVDPHRAWFPEKLALPNFESMESGTWPRSSLLVTLSWVRFRSEAERSGTWPERALFCNRRVRRWVSLATWSGIGPRMLLSEMSRRRRRRREDICGGISPEKSLWER